MKLLKICQIADCITASWTGSSIALNTPSRRHGSRFVMVGVRSDLRIPSYDSEQLPHTCLDLPTTPPIPAHSLGRIAHTATRPWPGCRQGDGPRAQGRCGR